MKIKFLRINPLLLILLSITCFHSNAIASLNPQANMRIIESLAKRLEIPLDKFHNNLNLYGNTSAASIGIALDEAIRANRIKKGDRILLVAFGAGLTWGSQIIQW